MDRLLNYGCRLLSAGAVVVAVLGGGLISSCGFPTAPVPVVGPGVSGNDVPTLEILEPATDITRGQGDPVLIRWTDSDRDDNARISFSLVNTATNEEILLIEGIEENDTTGLDSVTVNTRLVPQGSYNLLGVIDDGVNAPVEVFATTSDAGASPRRLIVRIVGEGEGGVRTQPPRIAVVEPQFNRSVSQDDVLTITVQPSLQPPDASLPYDPDSDITLFILLDFDTNPNNDDPANPAESDIILLRTQTIQEDTFDAISFQIPIDLNVVVPRETGDPYFIRATVDDSTNPRVHQYAVGTINVVRLAAGLVDLFDIGRVSSGVRFYGFNPGARLGSTMTTVSDFDADGVDDFLMVAQFGNTRNAGLVGEAYLVYGVDQARFGGAISVNSISDTISGVVFEAPPVRDGQLTIPDPNARTDGISSAAFIPDLTGDGRPDLLFGLRHVHGAIESMDYDPADQNVTTDTGTDIEVVVRQGQVTVQEGDGAPEVTNIFYTGVDDTTISSASPNTNFGSEDTIEWVDNGPGDRKWGLIKFSDVLDEIPDTIATLDISSVSATLEFDVSNTGGNGSLRECFTDFNEATTFATFAQNEGEPEEGVDYSDDEIGNINGTAFGTVTVDISDLVAQLINGQLSAFDDELRFIILPPATGDDASDETEVRSSETLTTSLRPILRIGYTRQNLGGGFGCYPDTIVNNETTSGSTDRDNYFMAGGMAVLVDSENRDNDPAINGATRLESTIVTLELVGQSSDVILTPDGINDNGGIFARADDGNEEGRISGARFMAGPYDWIDASFLGQEPRNGLFGDKVASIGDLNNDGVPEIIVSAPRNELHLEELFDEHGFQSTHWQSSTYTGSIVIFSGADYNDSFWRDKTSGTEAVTSIPVLDNVGRFRPPGSCSQPARPRDQFVPADAFEVFAEDVTDMLGAASSAGDFNQDGIDDILCGAYLNDRSGKTNTGAVYILYGRPIIGEYNLKDADDPLLRPPMLRVRGVTSGDQIGRVQTSGLDVNGDRIDDVFFGAPEADFGGVTRATCGADFTGDGLFDENDLRLGDFNSCSVGSGDEVFSDDRCKVFDYDNDGDIDEDDRCVFCCLSGDCAPESTCTLGLNENACCANMVDNGFVGVIFGGVFIDGDRDITQLGTTDLPGARFFGAAAGHRAGHDVSSAGDFNRDGFGDLLIVVPGETRLDSAGRERVGVVYLIFGGPHLENTEWNLNQVGSEELPGIVFLSPYVKGRPNEAAPLSVAFIGDINADGFDDIAIGNPKADFIDLSFPQGPDAPGGDAAVGRRRNTGDVYIVYGNNFGSNRGASGGG